MRLICRVKGCETNVKVISRKLCGKHYQRWYAYGDPAAITKTRVPNLSNKEFIKWMKTRVVARPNLELGTPCWEWQGSRDGKGYGIIQYEGKPVRAHRLMWYLDRDVWPEDMLLHSCDHPWCINLNHLREGSNQDNMDDMKNKNRQQKGEAKPAAKLTEADVLKIRRLRKKVNYPVRCLAKRFGISVVGIYEICNRHSWTHI